MKKAHRNYSGLDREHIFSLLCNLFLDTHVYLSKTNNDFLILILDWHNPLNNMKCTLINKLVI